MKNALLAMYYGSAQSDGEQMPKGQDLRIYFCFVINNFSKSVFLFCWGFF